MDVLSFRATRIYASCSTYIRIEPHVYTYRAERLYVSGRRSCDDEVDDDGNEGEDDQRDECTNDAT